jgi:chromosome partitioning protein
VNALTAADYLIIPLAPDFASIKGFDVMLKSISLVREYEAVPLEILGVFPTQARRTMHARETMNALYRKLGELWIDIQVPQAVAVQDAQAARTSLREFDRDGKATLAYRRIADTLLARLDQRGVELVEERRSA